jgi:spermidine/putrescine transport system substrate-binding protein
MSRRESDQRDAELHAFLREAITRRGFIRRSAFGAGGLVLGNSLLAACRRGGKEGRLAAGAGDSAAATAAAGGGGKTLRISNWPLYIDKQTVPDFREATGIKTEYTEDINDNGEFFAKIDEPLKRNQSIDRDIIVLTDWMAGRMIHLGFVAPL